MATKIANPYQNAFDILANDTPAEKKVAAQKKKAAASAEPAEGADKALTPAQIKKRKEEIQLKQKAAATKKVAKRNIGTTDLAFEPRLSRADFEKRQKQIESGAVDADGFGQQRTERKKGQQMAARKTQDESKKDDRGRGRGRGGRGRGRGRGRGGRGGKRENDKQSAGIHSKGSPGRKGGADNAKTDAADQTWADEQAAATKAPVEDTPSAIDDTVAATEGWGDATEEASAATEEAPAEGWGDDAKPDGETPAEGEEVEAEYNEEDHYQTLDDFQTEKAQKQAELAALLGEAPAARTLEDVNMTNFHTSPKLIAEEKVEKKVATKATTRKGEKTLDVELSFKPIPREREGGRGRGRGRGGRGEGRGRGGRGEGRGRGGRGDNRGDRSEGGRGRSNNGRGRGGRGGRGKTGKIDMKNENHFPGL